MQSEVAKDAVKKENTGFGPSWLLATLYDRRLTMGGSEALTLY